MVPPDNITLLHATKSEAFRGWRKQRRMHISPQWSTQWQVELLNFWILKRYSDDMMHTLTHVRSEPNDIVLWLYSRLLATKALPYAFRNRTVVKMHMPIAPVRPNQYRRNRSPLLPSLYRSLLASRSDSSKQRISFSRTSAGQISIEEVKMGGQIATWALDVTDDASGSVVHELDADLSHTTTGACQAIRSRSFGVSIDFRAVFWKAQRREERERTGSAQHAGDLDELDRNLGGIHIVYCGTVR